jgi:predicted Fe-Mo cluster-binding NifX family protein
MNPPGIAAGTLRDIGELIKTKNGEPMRVALTTWNGRISPVCDVARQVLILDIEDGQVTARHEETLPGTEPQDQAVRLTALGPQLLICGAISQHMADLLVVADIRVIPFTAGTIEEVVAAWLSGDLPNPALSMPGCCGRMRRCRGGRPGGRGRQAWGSVQRLPSNIQT